MRSSSSKFLVLGLTALAFVTLPACVQGTTSSSTATAPAEATTANPPTVVVPPPPPATAAPNPTPQPTPAAGAVSLTGTWESSACGDRAYPRHITFADASRFTAEDLVSPCPKGTACIWSGILNFEGTYRVEKDAITLKVEKASAGPKKVQFPTRLTLDPSGAPVEAGSDGKACQYKLAATNKRP